MCRLRQTCGLVGERFAKLWNVTLQKNFESFGDWMEAAHLAGQDVAGSVELGMTTIKVMA